MNRNSKSRLRVLRDEIRITQEALAKRAGLSLPYIKKLERGKKPMSQRPAEAIAIATGVDWRWLAGKGNDFPIMARLGMTDANIVLAVKNRKPSKELRDKLAEGVTWKKEMANAIQNHKLNPKNDKTEKLELQLYRQRHFIISSRLAQVIQLAIKKNRAELCITRIENFIRELAAEPWLKVKSAKPSRR
jgi:transcriptional regulator with XRE-family HTH domain